MGIKAIDSYLTKYKVHIIVVLAIITSNLKYIFEFELENFSFGLLFLLPFQGLLASCAFAVIMYVGVLIFKHYTDKDKGKEFENKVPFTIFLLLTAIINLLMFIGNGTTILDLLVD